MDDIPQRARWRESMAQAISEIGPPLYGLGGGYGTDGIFSGRGGQPCHSITIRYGSDAGHLTVTNSRDPLGGTQTLVGDVLGSYAFRVTSLPVTLTVSERLVMLPVDGTQTQFRVVEANVGMWVAVGGLGHRHLKIRGDFVGRDAVQPESLHLVLITMADQPGRPGTRTS